MGHWKRPNWDEIRANGMVHLKAGYKFECPVVFFTTRDASIATDVESSNRIIKEHNAQILVIENVQRTVQTLNLLISPQSSPTDDTLRFYEPSESHFMVKLPQYI